MVRCNECLVDSVVAATQYLCVEIDVLTTLLVAAAELKLASCVLELCFDALEVGAAILASNFRDEIHQLGLL